MNKLAMLFVTCLLIPFAGAQEHRNFSGLQTNNQGLEPTLRCFQNGRQVLQESGQFVSNRNSGNNIYKFGNKAGGINIIMFDLGETVCTLTKLTK